MSHRRQPDAAKCILHDINARWLGRQRLRSVRGARFCIWRRPASSSAFARNLGVGISPMSICRITTPPVSRAQVC